MTHLCARPGCGNAVKKSRRKHCSSACANAGRRLDRRCEECGKPRHEGKRFCSRQCATDANANSSPSPHSDAMRAKFRAMWAAGEKVAVIALACHVTPNVIVGLRRRMKLPKRPSPIKPRDPNAPPVVRKPPVIREKPALPPLVSVARMPLQQKQWAALASRPPQPAPSTNVVQLRLPIAPPRACQYPLWGALHADDRPVFARMCDDPRPGSKPRFCGAPAVVGCSYCKRHVALTHRKIQDAA